VTIRVKEFNYDPPHVRGPFRCPNCGDGLKFHWIKSSAEHEEGAEREARRRVNVQRWRRDQVGAARERGDAHPEWAGIAIPGSVIPDESLPE
jgi:hypothetical protein